MISSTSPLTRRAWLTHTAGPATVAVLAPWSRPFRGVSARILRGGGHPSGSAETAARVAAHAARWAPASWQTLAQQAVEAARTAGASYADARLTRSVTQWYAINERLLWKDIETVGVGVRVLVNGAWGFAASPFWTPDDVVQLTRDAVAQAKVNAIGTPRAVDVAPIPVVTGAWETPVRIDPFHITIEEKVDHFVYWQEVAQRAQMPFLDRPFANGCRFRREERVVATSDGSLFTQTLYDSAGWVTVQDMELWKALGKPQSDPPSIGIHALNGARVGWELFLDAHLGDPDTYARLHADLAARTHRGSKPTPIGRYTLVCDGATMAALVGATLGVATQLDRALGYEANAAGTSVIDDPLAMVGNLRMASPLVTVTANRSAPTQYATVQWDDEGVVPPEIPLITDGVLTDFQTTREQAAWLAPYYEHHGRPVRSNGCAAADTGLSITMQHMPNLALAPTASPTRLEDLVADVKEGILVEGGFVWQLDAQAKNGVLDGEKTEIRNGRLGRTLEGLAVMVNASDVWQHLTAVGGPTTVMLAFDPASFSNGLQEQKGQPPQSTLYSVQAAAAILPNQPLIDLKRKI